VAALGCAALARKKAPHKAAHEDRGSSVSRN
jgi:hypothetical protein